MVFEKAKAKKLGMSLEEYRKMKAELKRLEGQERVALAKWKIEQKYKQKRKEVKSGKRGKRPSLTAMLETLGGSSSGGGSDPLGIFGEPKRTRKKKRKKGRKK